jgi:hypothetical protein
MAGSAKGFFAYPSDPISLSETVKNAVLTINAQPSIHITPWEQARTGGKVVVTEICRLIDDSGVFLADLTGLNPNVIFELGYAVARNKRVLIILDTTLTTAKRDYEQLRLLNGVGYCSYINSRDIVEAFFAQRPFEDASSTILSAEIQPHLVAGQPPTLLYLKNRYENEADRKVGELVAQTERSGLACTIDDPNEARAQPLTWYGQKVYSALAVLSHFCSEEREGGRVHNARYAFVSGLAHGFEKPLLMLAEAGYKAPFDYQHLMLHYATAQQALERTGPFVQDALSRYAAFRQAQVSPRAAIELATELKSLRLGEILAENEADELDEYFVDTSAYEEALLGRQAIFVGRKGSGKTANLLHLASVLGADKRNLVVVIKPVGYDLSGVTRLLNKYRERDAKGYLVESLWKFLLYTELARAAAAAIEARPSGPADESERKLMELVAASGPLLRDDFAVKLEKTLEALLPLPEEHRIEDTRVAISEALHGGLLQQLRSVVGDVLHRRERVALLVDNLDKAWDPNGDLERLSELILGLLSTARTIPVDFAKSDRRRKAVNLTLAIFLRSDIFQYVIRAAHEPDKLLSSRITWSDPELLLRVVDRRLVASQRRSASAESLWARFFVPTVGSTPTRTYFASRVLPRPRDILFFARAAIAAAINRAHALVDQTDIDEAEKQYSQYALDTVEAEGSALLPNLGGLLYEFAGAGEILHRDELEALMRKAGFGEADFDKVTDYLANLSFLGLETGGDVFHFAADESEARKNSVLARKLLEARGSRPRYRINAPFHRYLEIKPI